MKLETDIFGGISISMWIWSGHIFNFQEKYYLSIYIILAICDLFLIFSEHRILYVYVSAKQILHDICSSML